MSVFSHSLRPKFARPNVRALSGLSSLAIGAVCALPAWADTPRVMTDLPAVQSLTARIIGSNDNVETLLTPGSSPHGAQLRPSEARSLANADLLIWLGSEFSPRADEMVDAIAPDIDQLALGEAPGVVLRELTEHGDHDDHDDHDKHDDHDDHAKHDDHDDHEDHDAKGHDDHDHAHGTTDPHLWLDPRNAAVWVGAIADKLAEVDPENAEKYRANAASALSDIQALEAEIAAQFAPILAENAAPKFVVYHDAYGYFTDRFGFPPAMTIADHEGVSTGLRRMVDLRETVSEAGAECLFTEPQFNAAAAEQMAKDLGLRVSVLDPLGANLEPGPDFYAGLLRGISQNLASCLTAE